MGQPKRRPSFVPPEIWEQTNHTIVLCFRHRFWALGGSCPECRPAKKPIPLKVPADDPYTGEKDPMRGELAMLPEVYAVPREIGRPYQAEDDGDDARQEARAS